MSFVKDGIPGLKFVNNNVKKYLSDDDIETWLRLYVLLYADDTIIFAENENDLHNSLQTLYNYCETFYFGNELIEICDDYTYLGVTFNYNGKFKKANISSKKGYVCFTCKSY